MIRALFSNLIRAFDRALARAIPMRHLQIIIGDKLARDDSFLFRGTSLPYFFHSYNNFGLTERMIEVPIIRQYLEQGRYQNVLEIGNVTNHYYDYFKQAFRAKTVIDKFEIAYDIINTDINQHRPDSKYDFIFSISTFEHMDSDLGRNPDYRTGQSKLISVAADNIKHVSDHLIRNGGRFVITAPLCYTPEWKETFYSGVFADCGFSEHRTYLFKRISELTWVQIPVEDGRDAPYDSYLPTRNYLSIVEFKK